MAHTKATGSGNRNVNVIGKRLGVKKFAGEYVKAGNIIIRQRGTLFAPGNNTMLGRDHTVFAVAEGFVQFRKRSGVKRGHHYVDVIPAVQTAKAPKSTPTKIKAVEQVEVVAEAKPKAAAKKSPVKTKSTKRTTAK